MKSTNFLLALLLFLVGTTAMAQLTTVPKVSTETEKHYYTFANNHSPSHNVVSQNIDNQPYFKGSDIDPAARFTFEQAYDENKQAQEGVYYIKSARFNAYVSYQAVNRSGNIKFSATAGDTEKWVLIRKDATSDTDLSLAIVTFASKDITETGERLGWNPSGGVNGSICLWDTNPNNNLTSFWRMTEVEVVQPEFTPISNFEDFRDGWYQMKTTVAYKREPLATDKYVSCIPSGNWNFTLDGLGARPATFVYISKHGENYHIMGPSGRYGQGNVTKGENPANLTLETLDEDKTRVQIHGKDDYNRTQYWAGWFLNDRIFIVGSSSGASTNPDAGNTQYCRFQLSNVDDFLHANYDVYNVTVTGFSDNPQVPVVYNHNGYEGVRTVYNGGAFFIPKGTEIAAGDFSVEGDVCDIVVNNEDKTITVSLRPSVWDKADAIMSNLGQLGYPATASQTMTTAYNNAATTKSFANMKALKTQYTSWATAANLQEVVLPESGKAYTIVFRPTNKEGGTYRYLNFTGNGLNTQPMADKNSEIPTSGVFVVTKHGDRYSLVPAYGSNYGHYLAYQSAPANYTVGVNDCIIESMLAGSNDNDNITDKSVENLAGYLYFKFDKRTSESSSKGVYIVEMSNGSFNNSTAPFLNGTFTSAVIMREATNYPGNVTLNEAAGIDDIDGIGTFSAPFAAIVPEGVTAYYVKETTEANGETWAKIEALPEGEVIPAGTGVLLTGSANTQALMVPATNETSATVTGNLLSHSAGADKAIPESENAYILTKKNDVVGFYPLNATSRTLKMNKSYLSLSTTSNAQRIQMDFGHTTTGIDTLPVNNTNAPIYDLSGRRVFAPAKGGIYIRGGKKFIIK